MKVKHNPDFDPAIAQAEKDFRNTDGKEMKEKCPYLFSSDMADAYWITAACLYWTGNKPTAIRRTRGNAMRIEHPIMRTCKAWVEKPDHRNGVRIVRDAT